MRKLKLKHSSWDFDLEMVITVLDEEKFQKECKEINQFWGGDDYRLNHHGSHENAGLALFAAESFQQMAFNNFKDKKWLKDQFDWSKENGVEGFPSFDNFGIEVNSIDTWFIESDEIKIVELSND
ncbi:hypothetical protein N473_12945 [Pseudoalteromonas luteoviolacea CPMOR-1]|uniref:DUF2528 family protein n=1 Tax=Pseudoalteromonas luteoviolacea CPMOR-1 TaxID=1365248 RepID=A0A167LNX0_9GAMM|nr:DUF2528 family protein [Pseudoalteromonas luteoviolacea]KZN64939.1 hypothetical protein N473_12945 [Pseudoalteromonas luteoviolacea CPMOR-1]